MGKRSSPDPVVEQAEFFRLVEVERSQSDPDLAIWHGRSRNARVAKVLAFMVLIRAPGRPGKPLSAAPMVVCKGASQQFFSATGDDQAAHLLPGQLLIDDAEPWLYLQGEPARLLQNEFAYVEPIHANFNRADWWAERSGMVEAFADACRAVLTGTGAPERDVADAYTRIWTPGALAGIAVGEAALRVKPQVPDLVFEEPDGTNHNMIANLEERGAAMNEKGLRNRFEQLSMLDYYRASFDETPRELEPQAIRMLLGL